MGFLSVPNLVPRFFQSLNRHCSVLLDHVALQLDREGLKGRQDSKTSAGWGDYLRNAIILNISIKGWGLFEGGD